MHENLWTCDQIYYAISCPFFFKKIQRTLCGSDVYLREKKNYCMIYVENFESRSFIHFIYVWLFVCVLVLLNVVAIW